ncbi:hypothetical protein MNBD_GAMMA21-2730 [hydrothermal vent metagenome]|uniref:ASPIC/UnbV domain-containing protein n=1 Tax=hydrothermal vent metagenome TaxID=652676 RepID=A0A3B1A0C7_9ZZZZ
MKQKIKTSRVAKRAIITAILVPGILMLAMYLVNPYFLTMPVALYRASSLTEMKDATSFLTYLYQYGSISQFNPDTGVSDFEYITTKYQNQKNPNYYELGKVEWHRGNFKTAVSHIERHHNDNVETEDSLFWLALSYMRLAEAKNCLEMLLQHDGSNDHTRMCTIPLTSFHQKKEYAKESVRLMERLLDEYDADNRRYQWLLNVNYMTINGFPDDVPERYRISGDFVNQFYGDKKREMEKKYADIIFHDRAKNLKVDNLGSGKGVAVEDFDRDGYLDVVTGSSYGNLEYYKNDNGKGFIRRGEEAGFSGIKGNHIITVADYDNDGWLDLFVARPFGDTRGDFVLLRNNGDATFTDVTVKLGLLPPHDKRDEHMMTFASAWGDIDNDGDLDLFVSGWGFYNWIGKDNPLAHNRGSVLYRNDGAKFTDVTKEYGLDSYVDGLNVFGAAFGDYDNDGLIDILLTSWYPGGYLGKNINGKRFERKDLIPTSALGFMTAFVDVNHDGRLDLFIADTALGDPVIKQTIFNEGIEGYNQGNNTIALQMADGTFENREDFFKDDLHIGTMGSSFGDINNDGAYDFYLGTGGPEGWYVMPNLMYMGLVDDKGAVSGYMDNISMLNGFGTLQKGHGIVFFDFDNDGDQDIYSSLGGAWTGDAWPNQLFVNDSKLDNTWVKIRLRGRRSNYYGLGARITVYAENAEGRQLIRRYYMDNKTGFGSAPYLAHIGLLDAVKITRVEVKWPGEVKAKKYTAKMGMLNTLDENGASKNNLLATPESKTIVKSQQHQKNKQGI